MPRFFALIIGTEILNRRRNDKHFDYLSSALIKKGYKLSGSFIIEDDPALIIETIEFIKMQPDSILFSFGGIGSTPDDYTRQCAATALKDGELYQNQDALKIITSNVDTTKYPHALNMANLPKDAKLLKNSVNKMPAFYLDNRFFFMPGFPEMSHPMVDDILENILQIKHKPTYRATINALCRESELIDIMKQLPENVELSSLPKLKSDGWQVVISVSSSDKKLTQNSIKLFTDELDKKNIYYSYIDD